VTTNKKKILVECRSNNMAHKLFRELTESLKGNLADIAVMDGIMLIVKIPNVAYIRFFNVSDKYKMLKGLRDSSYRIVSDNDFRKSFLEVLNK